MAWRSGASGEAQRGLSAARVALVAAFVALALFSLGSYLFSMMLGLHMLYFTSEGQEVARQSVQLLRVYVFFYLSLPVPWPVTLGHLFAALWLIVAASMIAAALGSPLSWTEALRGGSAGALQKLFGNYLLSMPVLANMLLFAVLAITGLQDIYGVPSGNISISDPYRGLVELSYASVMEELAFRIVPLGLVLLLRLLLIPAPAGSGWRRFAWAFLSPERAKSQSGLTGVRERGPIHGLSVYEWGAILLSSAVFALAHVLSGIGWKTGKLTTTFLSGLILGLTYLYYGVPGPILLHWYFNYYGGILEFAPQLYSGPVSLFAGLSDLVARATGGLAWLMLSLYFFLKGLRPQKWRAFKAERRN
ncbi:MAG: CPBP family intramembrane glutamic endopeptidase [Candidatus Bathyarchaeia archaeon]